MSTSGGWCAKSTRTDQGSNGGRRTAAQRRGELVHIYQRPCHRRSQQGRAGQAHSAVETPAALRTVAEAKSALATATALVRAECHGRGVLLPAVRRVPPEVATSSVRARAAPRGMSAGVSRCAAERARGRCAESHCGRLGEETGRTEAARRVPSLAASAVAVAITRVRSAHSHGEQVEVCVDGKR